MHRTAPCLFLILALCAAPSTAADAKKGFKKLSKTLLEVQFEKLTADERDRYFEGLGSWDHTGALKPIAQIASRYGAYIDYTESMYRKHIASQRKFGAKQGYSEDEAIAKEQGEMTVRKWAVTHKYAEESFDVLAAALGSFKDPKAIDRAFKNFQKHPSWRVRALLALACRHWHAQLQEEKSTRIAFDTLRKMMTDTEPRVRLAVVRSLASFHRTEALETLTEYMKDPDWRVRAAAVKSIEKSGSNEAVSALIGAMAGEKGRLKDDIEEALTRLTGETHGFADVWARWWHDVDKQIPPRGKTDGEKPITWKDKVGHGFYGLQIRSDKILFVIDISGSMNEPIPQQKVVVTTGMKVEDLATKGKTRLEVAKNEFKRAINKVNSKSFFSIVFFNHGVQTWRKEMQLATPEIKRRARLDIDKVQAAGATFTLGALREAFTVAGVLSRAGTTGSGGPKVDTIVLLSDGAPTDSKIQNAKLMDPDLILNAVRDWNKTAGIVIHTIAVDVDDNYFLRSLALQSGGKFVERNYMKKKTEKKR